MQTQDKNCSTKQNQSTHIKSKIVSEKTDTQNEAPDVSEPDGKAMEYLAELVSVVKNIEELDQFLSSIVHTKGRVVLIAEWCTEYFECLECFLLTVEGNLYAPGEYVKKAINIALLISKFSEIYGGETREQFTKFDKRLQSLISQKQVDEGHGLEEGVVSRMSKISFQVHPNKLSQNAS